LERGGVNPVKLGKMRCEPCQAWKDAV